MVKRRTAALLCLATCFFGSASATSAALNDENIIWGHERAYWQYVQANDLTAYRKLWHQAFVGWPYVSAAPVRKDHITDWITSQTGKGLRFKTIALKPASLQITGNIAAAFYWETLEWVDKSGKGTVSTIRVMHTWLKDGSDWHIIDGMSMPAVSGSH